MSKNQLKIHYEIGIRTLQDYTLRLHVHIDEGTSYIISHLIQVPVEPLMQQLNKNRRFINLKFSKCIEGILYSFFTPHPRYHTFIVICLVRETVLLEITL